ncbi:MAG TPA: hypothetical protein VKR52_15210 [Terracidiphilus sp.]|nr:hypothetical protein [Terracidiphilus sp.]
MIKKQLVFAFALLLLIPIVTMAGGMLSSLVNPEIAAGHPNYARNWHLLNGLKIGLFLGSIAIDGVLWIAACFLVIRSKRRSPLWLVLAILGPVGFAILATLNDRDAAEAGGYAQFVRGMNWLVRGSYEIGTFVLAWVLAYQAMLLGREVIIRFEAITQGVSVAQIRDIQSASSGMWAFGEAIEVIYLVALLYALRPLVFGVASHVATRMKSAAAG